MLDKFLSDKTWKIATLVLFLLLFIQQCSTSRKLKYLKRDNDLLNAKIQEIGKPLSQKETRDIIENVMFDFLIYEDDLDKNKTNLTDIKTKIEK